MIAKATDGIWLIIIMIHDDNDIITDSSHHGWWINAYWLPNPLADWWKMIVNDHFLTIQLTINYRINDYTPSSDTHRGLSDSLRTPTLMVVNGDLMVFNGV